MPEQSIPYFSQWETPGMTLAVLAEGAERALLRDPAWRNSGAASVEEYARWAGHLCGMACLKMLLAGRTGIAHPILELARGCAAEGGYVETPEGDIRGLIYAPFVSYVEKRFGLRADIRLDLAAEDLPALLPPGGFFLASVHKDIRWPERAPPTRGGHLVLVTRATPEAITFHNPSGHEPAAQADVALPPAVFGRFFAGRGILIA
ncbi:hypothetical protein [Teichococcus cervicalis]|uniref:Peptidase C39-like domain-containing protein n=1 Tax=Pseudoroseomonas cervicalis ATCC 49957 TaxID=525371 RepID=D5RHW7_9PROT|nr:hypothetical protein [Pseudoroseomonas cervicalis]EFH13100.1 hypothetical protein HMPREF0731_0677 [Pseudoroseomonas cervicalis ATCC 49957]